MTEGYYKEKINRGKRKMMKVKCIEMKQEMHQLKHTVRSKRGELL